MDVKELRIGNRILADGRPSTVMVITANGKIVVKTDGWQGVDTARQDNDNSRDCKAIEPIPLTPELLKAYGFEFSSNYIYQYNRDNNILFDAPTDWNNTAKYPVGISAVESSYLLGYISHGEIIIRCLNLHQLQNMFYSITGKEL